MRVARCRTYALGRPNAIASYTLTFCRPALVLVGDRAPEARLIRVAKRSIIRRQPAPQGSKPCRTAYAAAAVRELTPILAKMLLTWG